MKMKPFLTPESSRLAITIIAAKLIIDLVLSQIILGMCYSHSQALNTEVERSVDSELTQ